MKHIKKYELFCEGYEEIMKDMVNDIDFDQIEKTNEQINKLKTKIELKKTELQETLDKLEKLQIETLSNDNKELLASKKIEIKNTIDTITTEIKKLEDTIKTLNDNISDIKQNNK